MEGKECQHLITMIMSSETSLLIMNLLIQSCEVIQDMGTMIFDMFLQIFKDKFFFL